MPASVGMRRFMSGNVPTKRPLTLTATTTAVNQTVTISRMTPATGASLTIVWGDGQATVVAAGDTGTKPHVYAAAGTYAISITDARSIVQIDVHDAKLSGLKSAELRDSVITYFNCYSLGAATASVIASADMSAWRPAYWYLYSMPAGGTYNIAALTWRPGDRRTGACIRCRRVVPTTLPLLTWRPGAADWYLYSMPAGTYNIASADMAAWRRRTGTCTRCRRVPTLLPLLTWRPGDRRTGTCTRCRRVVPTSIACADMAAWRPAYWYLYSMPAVVPTTSPLLTWRPGDRRTGTCTRCLRVRLPPSQPPVSPGGLGSAIARHRTTG